MRKVLSIFLIALSLVAIPFASSAEYRSDICDSSKCSAQDVGAFMQGITEDCAELGNCTLQDIMLVFANVGNFVLGIVGGFVLLMYIIGGFYMLSSGGYSERIQKGKKYLKMSTVGLLIVMFAYLGIFTLKGTLLGTGTGGNYVLCDSTQKTTGALCGLNSECTENGICISRCEGKYQGKYSCKEVDPSSNFAKANCESGLCPGSASTLCCANPGNAPTPTPKPNPTSNTSPAQGPGA